MPGLNTGESQILLSVAATDSIGHTLQVQNFNPCTLDSVHVAQDDHVYLRIEKQAFLFVTSLLGCHRKEKGKQ